jgi:hypothetical protein
MNNYVSITVFYRNNDSIIHVLYSQGPRGTEGPRIDSISIVLRYKVRTI